MQITSWWMGSARTWEAEGPNLGQAGLASFRQPAPLEGPVTWCRSMRWKSSGFRLRPSRPNTGVLQALRYRWSPSPARTRFAAPRSSTSAVESYRHPVALRSQAVRMRWWKKWLLDDGFCFGLAGLARRLGPRWAVISSASGYWQARFTPSIRTNSSPSTSPPLGGCEMVRTVFAR